tara:strand:- start:117 stop:305 length:189 start_codon:yes stop_codon:yes gene_type:complete
MNADGDLYYSRLILAVPYLDGSRDKDFYLDYLERAPFRSIYSMSSLWDGSLFFMGTIDLGTI